MASLMCVVFSLSIGMDVDKLCCFCCLCSSNIVSNNPLFYVYSVRIVNMISMSTVLDKDQAIGTEQTWPLLRETALWLE